MIVDTNVYLSRWPFRRLPLDETPALVGKLRENGITQAWAGSLDGLLHKDVAAVNARLVDECRRHGPDLLLPFGTVNPKLPDWQEDLRRCHEEHGMPGIRLHPNYAGCEPDDPDFVRLLEMAAERGLIVQLVVKMQDERTQHPLMRVKAVSAAPLAELLDRIPKLELVILNGLRDIHGKRLDRLAATRRAWFDIAMLEGAGALERMIRKVGIEVLLFGSFAPLFYIDSAAGKIRESPLASRRPQKLLHGNARALLARVKSSTRPTKTREKP